MSTSVSPSASRPAKAGSAKNRRVLRRWVVGISAVLLTLVLLIVIRTQGHVTGQEFSPTHFQQRRFSFYEIPLIHLQITPIRRAGSTPSTALYIRQNSLIKPTTGTPTNWHLVSISRGLTGQTPADPKLLIDQLEFQHGGSHHWRQWSIDHTKRAQVFWPIIQKLAERELYILMPELFEIAQHDLTPTELVTKIDDLLKRRYHGLVLDMQAADREELAQQLLGEALLDYPDDPRLLGLRRSLATPPAASDSPSS